MDKDALERYSRQIALPEIGLDGQQRLLDSSVLIVGAGGLGSPAALYLAAAGVGRIGLVDNDAVDLSNLQRQILHRSSGIGTPKAESGAQALRELNPSVIVDAHKLRLDKGNAASLFKPYDFIIDACDNFPTKLLIAEAAWHLGKPHSYGGISGFCGQAMTVIPKERTACVRCLLRSVPEEAKAPTGPIGALPGVIGSIQALEALKVLAGLKASLVSCVLDFDALSMNFRKVPIRPNPACPLCSGRV